MIAPDASQVARFRRDLATTLGRSLDAGERIALAVSGGPDSMAMLALGRAALPGQIVAATVDHGLREAARDEAAMVAAWCGAAGIDHFVLKPEQPLARGSIQAAARQARYDLLGRWAAARTMTVVATAHHADDQAETFLMRALRGSGVAGLAGIRPRRPITAETPSDVTLIRPLLGWRAATLRALVIAAAVPFVDDPSNSDDRYARSHVRRLLAEHPAIDPAQIALAATHVGEADAALEVFAQAAWIDRAVRGEDDGGVTLDTAGLPREVTRRLTRRAIACVRQSAAIVQPAFDSASNIEPLLGALDKGERATHAGVMVSVRGKTWHFRVAPPRRGH